jgi:hypothetical protein
VDSATELTSELRGLYMLLLDREETLRPKNRLLVTMHGLDVRYPGLLGHVPGERITSSHEAPAEDALTDEIRSHPGYRWLTKVKECSDGLEIVRNHSQDLSETPWLTLLREVIYWQSVAVFFLRSVAEGSDMSKTFSAKEKRDIAKQARHLSEQLKLGAGRFSTVNSFSLRDDLDRFAGDLEKKGRRDYARRDWKKVQSLKSLAKGLFRMDFKNDTPIVEILDIMSRRINLVRTDRTLQRYVSDARKRLI